MRQPIKSPAREPRWIRVRRVVPKHGSLRRGARRTQWIYFVWNKTIRELAPFERAYFGSYREREVLDAMRPRNVGTSPIEIRDGVPLYIEAAL